MKTLHKFLITVIVFVMSLAFSQLTSAQTYPPLPPEGVYVLDQVQGGLFSPSQIENANATAAQLWKDGVAKIYLVALQDCGSPNPDAQKAYATGLLNHWQVGDINKKNGLILLYCWQNGYRNQGRSLVTEPGSGYNYLITKGFASQQFGTYIVPVLQANGQDKSPEELLGPNKVVGEALVALQSYYAQLLRRNPPVLATSVPASNSAISAPVAATIPSLGPSLLSICGLVGFGGVFLFGFLLLLLMLGSSSKKSRRRTIERVYQTRPNPTHQTTTFYLPVQDTSPSAEKSYFWGGRSDSDTSISSFDTSSSTDTSTDSYSDGGGSGVDSA